MYKRQTVDVEITERVKENNTDFDWDEAVVYFMLTDRFFDGNKSNNTASGADMELRLSFPYGLLSFLH